MRTAGDGDRELAYGQVLVAAGRRPAATGLNLDTAGVKARGHGEVITDSCQRTANPRIWAAGDVTGGSQYVNVAVAQGSVAAGNALLHSERRVDYSALPRVTFTSPAIASAGLTEAELLARGVPCDCRVVLLEAVPRAVVAPDAREGEAHDRHERLLIRKPQAMFPVWNPGHGLVYARQPSDRVAAEARRRPPDALQRAPYAACLLVARLPGG
jgi:NADPH-dependent 2,4-dienoyl-CoA reductase/sulfur reductase-like enzyme